MLREVVAVSVHGTRVTLRTKRAKLTQFFKSARLEYTTKAGRHTGSAAEAVAHAANDTQPATHRATADVAGTREPATLSIGGFFSRAWHSVTTLAADGSKILHGLATAAEELAYESLNYEKDLTIDLAQWTTTATRSVPASRWSSVWALYAPTATSISALISTLCSISRITSWSS